MVVVCDYSVLSYGPRQQDSRCQNCDQDPLKLEPADMPDTISISLPFNPSARGHLNPSSYCDVGRFFLGVFKF